LPGDIQGLIAAALADLEADTRHRKPIVAATLAKLAASRAGLTESELIDLLGRDGNVVADFRRHSRYEYVHDGSELPPIVWSRLLLDLKFFLGQSSAGGAGLLDFYHRQLEFAVRERYADEVVRARHDIADYFLHQSSMLGGDDSLPNGRRSYELIWQLRAMGTTEALRRVEELLGNREFVEAKAQTGLVRDLLEDYFRCADETNFNRLARFLGDFLLSGTGGAERLEPEVVQSYLSYLSLMDDGAGGRPSLYRALLDDLVARDLSPEAGSEAKRRVARSKISLGEQHRRKGEFDKARALLEVLGEPGARLNGKDLATGWYERAYIEYLEDNYALAVDYFDRSISAAQEADDAVGAAIPFGPRQWARYFVDPTDEMLREGIARETEALVTLRRHELTDPRAERWVRNTLAHLANLHYYLDDAEGMTLYVVELKNNPWVRDYESANGVFLKEQHEARYLCAKRRYGQAADAWREMFEQTRIRRTQQAAAWLMYDYGFAVERSGRKVLAAQIYADGLNTPPKGACNAFWHAQIRTQMNGLSRQAREGAKSLGDYVSPLR
jgi:tetratricopeptide (TPR) repeat protein